jgi:hypothetical protein
MDDGNADLTIALRIADCRMRIAECGLTNAMGIAECRLMTAGPNQPAFLVSLKTTVLCGSGQQA